jgi:indole-3-glycerol phosphate synthase
VLTEQRRFSGSLADLDAVRAAVDIPILRKDFMVEPYQVLEARAHGADVILLIVAGLSDAQMQELNQFALELGMSVLVEIHDEAELERALRISPKLLGINARNLKTLEVDLATCHRLLPKLPVDVVAVAESGISQLHEVQELATSGARAILVGEALVTGGTPTETVREWLLAGTLSRAQAKEIESL